MVAPVRRRASYDELRAVPPHQVGELIDGELHVSPRPAKTHAAAIAALNDELGPPFRRGRGGPGGWFILDEPELHVGGDVLVPDLAGWRRARMPVLANDAPYFTLAPDWVCEVSPSSAATDRAQKLPIYAREGVPHVWLVDPLQRTLEVGEIITKHAKNPKLEEPVHSSLEPTKPNLQLVLITKTKLTNKIKTSANITTPLAIITIITIITTIIAK